MFFRFRFRCQSLFPWDRRSIFGVVLFFVFFEIHQSLNKPGNCFNVISCAKKDLTIVAIPIHFLGSALRIPVCGPEEGVGIDVNVVAPDC